MPVHFKPNVVAVVIVVEHFLVSTMIINASNATGRIEVNVRDYPFIVNFFYESNCNDTILRARY